jgi:hypothetical protein
MMIRPMVDNSCRKSTNPSHNNHMLKGRHSTESNHMMVIRMVVGNQWTDFGTESGHNQLVQD